MHEKNSNHSGSADFERGSGKDDRIKTESTEHSLTLSSIPVNSEEAAKATDISSPPPPADISPNGGYGWVCVACVAVINAHTWGMNASYGVFLNYYLTNNIFPNATYLQYAFVGALSISCALLLSPIATITTREFGTRTTLLLGTVLEAGALIAASFSSQTWHLFLTQGVCYGFGMGLLFVGSVGIVPQWFTTRRSLANGIATAGSGFGGLLYSLATGAMIPSIGLPWTFRVLGLLALGVNTVCSLLLRDRNKQIGSSQLAFDVTLFRRVEYLLLLAFGCFSMLAYVVLLFSLANYAQVVGLDASQAATVQAILNLGQGLGRPPIGYFSDAVGRINMAFLATFVAGLLALALWIPAASSFGVLIFYALVGGAVAGTFWTVIAPVAVEVVGIRDVPSALNLVWLVLAVPCTFSQPIGLEIVNFEGGRYLGAQIFTGMMYIAASGCCFLLRGWKIGELRAVEEVKAGEMEGMGGTDEVVDEAKRRARRRMLFDCWKWQKV